METLIAPVINRVLRRNRWSLDKLKAFAGRTARFELPFLRFQFTVQDTGEVAAAVREAAPQVVIVLTPGILLRVLARDESVWSEISVSGDTDFATVLNHISRNLRWDIEEDLSRVFGDIAAHRMVQTGRTLDQWRAQSFDSVTRSFAEYWTEEQPLIARARDVGQFNRDVDRLRDDAARLEKRLEHLITRS
ncbi:MAG TPA: hypothetical protein VJ834_11425 [Burkholderiales bacterium]|nr:hypothetical protein [Burkholderiales bacterium]